MIDAEYLVEWRENRARLENKALTENLALTGKSQTAREAYKAEEVAVSYQLGRRKDVRWIAQTGGSGDRRCGRRDHDRRLFGPASLARWSVGNGKPRLDTGAQRIRWLQLGRGIVLAGIPRRSF